MIDRTSDENIPDHRVPDILARAAELDRSRTETSSIDALRAVAQDAGISLSSLEAALEEYAANAEQSTAESVPYGKNPTTGTLLAVFLGGFGAHRFYLHDNLGLIYLIFFWTLIPSICGLVEAFFMPDRVRAYNSRAELIEAVRSHRLAAGDAAPNKRIEGEKSGQAGRVPCPRCAEMILPDAKFCRFCRTDLVTRSVVVE